MSSECSDQLIKQVWEELERKCTLVPGTGQRTYQRLDLEQENGIRLSCVSPGSIWELLIEAGEFDEKVDIDFPKWKGMEFEVLVLDVPSKGTRHINFYLEKREHRDIFVSICRDLIQGLNSCFTNKSRRAEIADFLTRWNRFFEHYGQEGLSPEKQRGLYGELWWLRRMINTNINLSAIVNSWKGSKRGYHDFEIGSHVVEVKTTMTKEPRRILINNERQLNDLALDSLHLFVLTLRKIDEGGDTLPGIIESI
ncbi:MAG: PD-(D/E)XK motif protein, partial [Flavobacteriales bacterium]|nr:PD-(D/E)XK motif protein [Flavobacteriales bacterium]